MPTLAPVSPSTAAPDRYPDRVSVVAPRKNRAGRALAAPGRRSRRGGAQRGSVDRDHRHHPRQPPRRARHLLRLHPGARVDGHDFAADAVAAGGRGVARRAAARPRGGGGRGAERPRGARPASPPTSTAAPPPPCAASASPAPTARPPPRYLVEAIARAPRASAPRLIGTIAARFGDDVLPADAHHARGRRAPGAARRHAHSGAGRAW